MEKDDEEKDFRKLGQLDIRVHYQLSYWAEELNVSRETLKLAWYEVGPDIAKIKAWLRRRK
jgi:hypothetical protein